jgi:alanine-synthesizing transaminase
VPPTPAPTSQETESTVEPIRKSDKLANVCYDIRGPVLQKAKQMEDEGHKIIKLNIGNLAPFGFDSPEEIQLDMIRNLPNAAGYSDSKGIFSARKAIMHYTQQKHIKGVTLEDIYVGNGVSELIVMAMNALLNTGDEVLVPAPDYPLWTAAVSLSGGTPRTTSATKPTTGSPISTTSAPRSRPHPGHRHHQPEQPDRRGVPRRDPEGHRRHRPRARPDHLRRRGLRQGALRRRQAHLHRLAVRGRADAHLQRPVQELPLLRLPRRLDGGVGRQAPAADYIEGLNMLASMRLCANVPGQFAIQTALGGYQSIDDLVAPGGRLRRQRDLAHELITAIPGVTCVKPKATLYMFPRLDPQMYPIEDDQQFIAELLEAERVLLVQGTGFNWPSPTTSGWSSCPTRTTCVMPSAASPASWTATASVTAPDPAGAAPALFQPLTSHTPNHETHQCWPPGHRHRRRWHLYRSQAQRRRNHPPRRPADPHHHGGRQEPRAGQERGR